jgi:hypothetical protein
MITDTTAYDAAAGCGCVSRRAAAAAIRSAARRLDAALPAGWRDRVDRAALDLTDGRRCVLGQLYGDYLVGVTTLYAGNVWPADAVAFTGCVPRDLWLAELDRDANVAPADDLAGGGATRADYVLVGAR